MDPDSTPPENPFGNLPTPTERVREKVAKQVSSNRTWQRCAVWASGCGCAGAILIPILGGLQGAVAALTTIALFAAISVGVTLGGVVFVGSYAVRYQRYVRETGVSVGARELAALMGAGVGLGAAGGVLWFAAELPGSAGWVLGGGTIAAASVGAVAGVLTAPTEAGAD